MEYQAPEVLASFDEADLHGDAIAGCGSPVAL
jgi:hypothetical protein